jgi:hypothetical protein
MNAPQCVSLMILQRGLMSKWLVTVYELFIQIILVKERKHYYHD